MNKVKEITRGLKPCLQPSEDQLIMEFRLMMLQHLMVRKEPSLAGKASINNQFNAFIMDYLKENGIKNHYIESLDRTHSLLQS